MNLAVSEGMRETRTLRPSGDVVVLPCLQLHPLLLPHAHVGLTLGVPRGGEILGRHCDHDRLLLFRVEKLDLALLQKVRPRVIVVGLGAELVVLRGLELDDVLLLERELLVLLIDDEERTTDSSGVRVEPQLSLPDVPHHRHLALDIRAPS